MNTSILKFLIFVILGFAAGEIYHPQSQADNYAAAAPEDKAAEVVEMPRTESVVPEGKQATVFDAVGEKESAIKQQLSSRSLVGETGSVVWMPTEIAGYFRFSIGLIGEKFHLSAQATSAYSLDQDKRTKLESSVNSVISSIRQNERRMAKIQVVGEDHMIVSVPPIDPARINWNDFNLQTVGLIGSENGRGLFEKIKHEIGREYPPHGRTFEVKLNGDKGVSVLIRHGNGARWQNSFPESISHLVSIAESQSTE